MLEANPRDYTFAFAITTILMDEKCSESIRDERFKAIQKAMGLTAQYLKDGIRPDLVDVIMEKKTKLILNASTLADIRKSADLPKPHYNGNTFYDDPLQVPEEEMVLWSKASLRAPLNSAAYERYAELFTRAFGVSVEEYCQRNHESDSEEVGA